MNRTQRRALAKSKDPQGLVQIADLDMRCSRLDTAEENNRLAIALDPDCYVAHNNLGNILRHTGRIAESVRHFSLAFRREVHEYAREAAVPASSWHCASRTDGFERYSRS